MRRMLRSRRAHWPLIAIGMIAGIALSGIPAYAQEGTDAPGAVKIPTVYRDAWTIMIKGKPQTDGTFSMVFKPHGEDGTEFTVNVVKNMGVKKIAQDVAKELTLASGARYKIKQKDNKIVVKKANKKSPPMAIELSNQKFTGMSIMIGK